MNISSSFWRFPGSEWKSATLSPNFHFCFSTYCFSIFLCFWWFSIVFHWFSWFSWISAATGTENEKKMIKNDKKINISLSFVKISRFGVRIFNFESRFSCFIHVQLHFFFIFLCFWWFSIVFFIDFHGFPGFQVTWARKMKKMIKTWF